MKQGDFTAVAKHYHNRPAYSSMLLEKLIRCINDEGKSNDKIKVIEVGAGTGKLTKMLAKDFNLNITAVEPNDNMREEGIKYTRDCPNISWKKGSGEKTGIESGIADWVIMASSFHWTDPKQSLPEFARILGGGDCKNGYFTAIYNPRHIVEGTIFDEIEKEIKHIVPELTRVSSGTQNVKKYEDVLISTGDFKDCFFMECDYTELWSKERYIGAWHSVNDIQAQAGEKRWKEILEMIESKISSMQNIEIPYKIRAWTAKKA
ncbi:class I SAM-dependent methyltransferase [Campylobacter cuniculorum]|uniref:SAM-dependent methyltransferase n=2 Tax=Campylobacter cuniculorum TaxID=374106 RepID=A0A1W6BXP6_9BACT|nr:class I SAM-dependent methyltransferase [Campylobacter cuniculorum]ARJ56896.1 SAM-dependent methyltransferase [Campylobacter cuniculorum DSM 23162 = LMG 24588]QOR04357.1 class I SAM-dependent methyltransferase [Campylobacter cuniculorum]